MFRNHWSVENSLHHVKDRSWDEDVHTLRRPGLGEIFATLVNTGLNALRLEGWFPARISMPLRAKTCAFRPTQTIARLYGRSLTAVDTAKSFSTRSFARSDKQVDTEPSTLTPQVWLDPALTEVKVPWGGVVSPYSSDPQQSTEPSSLTPQVWAPTLTEVKVPRGGVVSPFPP